MRIWDINPAFLCDRHLLSEHQELHCIWNVLTKNKKGYSNHPETNRWRGYLPALNLRHDMLAAELISRGMNHVSPLADIPEGPVVWPAKLMSVEEQINRLIEKSGEMRCKAPPCVERLYNRKVSEVNGTGDK